MANHAGSKLTWRNIAIIMSLCLGSLNYGYDFSMATFTLGQPTWNAYMGEPGLNLIGTVLGLFSAGAVFGAVFVGWFCDAHGRKKSLIIAAFVNIIGGALQAGSVNIGMFIAARFITGFAAAMFVTVVPIYIAEIAPPAVRGLLVGQHGASFIFGYVLAAWSSTGTFFSSSPAVAWRVPLSFQCLWPLVLLAFIKGVPESPRWLIEHGRSEDAWKVLEVIHKDPNDESQSFARKEFHQITMQLAADQETYGKVTVLDLFTRPTFRKRMIVAAIVMFTSQATGNLVIYSNISLLYSGLGLSSSLSLVVSALYITWCFVCNFCSTWFLDRLGRVNAMSNIPTTSMVASRSLAYKSAVIGFTSGACVIAIETALVATYTDGTDKAGLRAAVAMLFVYITTYGGFCDVTIYVYCSEIFPTHIRVKGMAWAICVFMITDIPFLETFTLGVAVIGWRYYLVFIIMAVVCVPVLWFFCPETKGLSLEEINGLFGDDVVVKSIELTDEETVKVDEKSVECEVEKSLDGSDVVAARPKHDMV